MTGHECNAVYGILHSQSARKLTLSNIQIFQVFSQNQKYIMLHFLPEETHVIITG